MLMKVFSKGQVVIPVNLRNALGIHVGEMLDVSLDTRRKCIHLQVPTGRTSLIAGSLSRYASGREFPGRKKMGEILKEKILRDKRSALEFIREIGGIDKGGRVKVTPL